eukprot:TRINITY_DN491_c0_g1_i1.p1 TRINITY_DN491_c0_g1~~TRINITY_DN491_c0_g1_i1.p1  ORF type:complete len:1536 (-),score=250.71 TRINITY_DN491_c0_g1_i1:9728-14335(-)
MRRSTRGLRHDAESAIADLAARKASGKSRTADYEVHEEADIFETVDEETYAHIAAQKRKEARDFIASNAHEDDEYVMEQEFEMEHELSLVQSKRDHQRKRTNAPRVRRANAVPTKRVATAFFNTFQSSAPKKEQHNRQSESRVLDSSMLDADFDKHLKSARAARKKKRAFNQSVGDLLFDAAAPQLDHEPLVPDAIPFEPEQPAQDQYDEPPPMPVSVRPPLHAKNDASSNPSVNLNMDDSIDGDTLLAAADAAIKSRDHVKVADRPVVKRAASVTLPPQMPTVRMGPPPVTANHPQANLPMARDSDGSVLMFWTDAHEMRVSGGEQLYLFGKVPLGTIHSNQLASVCVQVKGMERVLYVLPRRTKRAADGQHTDEPVKIIPDVHAEISKLLLGSSNRKNTRLGGAAIRSASNLPSQVKAKKVVRCCPFADTHAPREPTEYLKVKIPYENYNRLSPESSGATFSRVYGTRTCASEALCLKRKLRGPGWIRLKNAVPSQTKVSHAKFTISISSPEDLHAPVELASKDPPPVSALCVSTKTVLNGKTGAHEVVMISGLFIREVPLNGPLHDVALEPGGAHGTRDFVLVRPPDGMSLPFGFSDHARSVLARGGGVEVLSSESALLNNFLTRLLRLDPDVIIGHRLMGFGLDVLLTRMKAKHCREWSRLGRLVQRRDLSAVIRHNTEVSSWFKGDLVAGRLMVDTHMHAKDLLPKEKDYSLASLSQTVLASSTPGGTNCILRSSIDVSQVSKAFEKTMSLCQLVSECIMEARTSGRLAAYLSVLPLTKQLTCISGNLWSHSLRGSRAERIEYLLCHEFKLIGSKAGGNIAAAGDVRAKLLLPDKLNRSEREKVFQMYEAEQALHRKKEADLAPNDHGFGGPGGNDTHMVGSVPSKTNATDRKQSGKPKSSRKKPQYSGGLVLEPVRGLYDRYVLQLDFNSLYPSIIQEFNICFTTLRLGESQDPDGPPTETDAHSAGKRFSGILSLPSRSVPEGVLPRVLRRLVAQRKQVKTLLKEERQRAGRETLRAQQLDIRQLAIKLTANSLYGCLGFEGGRFYARPLAEMVTSQGRDTLQKTVDLARDSFNAKVIYGDTDSLFVYTGMESIDEVRKLGTELKRDVNKKYRTLEIEIDAIYKKMLLLRKKKYAALKVVDPSNPDKTVREVKGIDLVRHDWCDLSHEASDHFLDQIFHNQSTNIDDAVGNILSYLSNLASRVKSNEVSLSKYVITRALNKRPQDYPEGHSTPHVAVASRMIKREKRTIRPGEYIKYVICTSADGSTAASGVASRAYHPDEVKASEGKLIIDVKYYLESQVLPPILRLCDPIEGIEASRVAVSLGLDGRRFEKRDDENDGYNDFSPFGPHSAAEKFSDVDPLMIQCGSCGVEAEFVGVQFRPSGELKNSGLHCAKCRTRFPVYQIHNTITLVSREWVRKYYTCEMVVDAEDGSRIKETRNVGLGPNGLLARRKFNEAWLYKQLRYLSYLLNSEERWKEVSLQKDGIIPLSPADKAVYDELFRRAEAFFDANAYRFIDLSPFLMPLGIC